MMDTVDAPIYGAVSRRQRSELPQTSFQHELRAKMKQRKKQGLSADLTSEESEVPDDGLDSEEENSFTMQYRANQKHRPDRPSSAKRRDKPDLGDTMRPGDAQRWIKSSHTSTKTEAKSSLRKTPPLHESPRHSKSDVDRMFGTLGGSPKSRTSPLDQRFGTSPGRDTTPPPLYQQKSKSRDSPTSLPKAPGGSQSGGPGVVDSIFGGRKTPTNESQAQVEKEWKAPSFRKSPVTGSDRSSPGLDARSGRKTPSDSSLQPITESPRAAPRSKRDVSPRETRLRSRDSSPRALSLESPRSERPKPKVGIFGEKQPKPLDLDEDEDRNQNARSRRFTKDKTTTRQSSLTGRKTPTGRETPTGQGRKTPTGRQTPTGRKTPTEGRQSPTGRRTRFSKDSFEDDGRDKKRAQPGLLDFLTDEAQPTKADKPKPRLRSERSTERSSALKKSVSQDSITGELDGQDQPSMLEVSSKDDGRIPADQSSVCAELDHDPDRARMRQKEREKQLLGPSKQRSDRKEADDIISRVEDAQSDPKQITKNRPASAKTSEQVLRPKPRHTLPGSRPSSAAASQNSELFNTTSSIRQTIYEEWRKAKGKEIKQKTQEQKAKELEEQKKKEKEEKDKKLESMASYNAWMKQKEETFIKEKQRKKREEEKKQHEKEKEELIKKKDAKKNFTKWKESKDERLLEEHKRKVEEKHRQKQEERNKKKEKEKDNNTAFSGWKTRKDERLKENYRKQQEEKLRTQRDMMRTQKKKEQEANDQYNEWIKKKEIQDRREAEIRRSQKLREEQGEDFRPPWSPANKIIPYGR